jgi:hypothetical protein
MFFPRKYFDEFGLKCVRFQVRASIAALCLWIVTGASLLHAVPVVPNESLVVGEVLEKSLVDSSALGIEPQQTLLHLKLRIITVEGVEGKENFLQGQEGKTIEVYAKELDSPVVATNSIEARITFRGDERMGRYWLVGGAKLKSK